MKKQPLSPRRLGITLRIALLSWLVTIVTLVIFLLVIIPEQKRTYLEGLQSKARGISASLQDITSGAVVTEDYSSVVDHCKQVLQGDRSIDYLVITKNDGFSLIHHEPTEDEGEATGAAGEASWRIDTLHGRWHPEERIVHSGIGEVDEFKHRLFHYSRPFDYSGIEWGWVHVGLSVQNYDSAVAQVYLRTGLLAVICLLFSLAASVAYASRLVRPLHELRDVVSQVSGGDLTARADIQSQDEIQDLSQSFNSMTDALLQRDRILESVRVAAQQFLATADWQEVIDAVLRKIGEAADVSRVYIFENHVSSDDHILTSQRYEWVAEGIESFLDSDELQNLSYVDFGFEEIAKRLEGGEMIAEVVSRLTPAEQAGLMPQGILSIVLVPVTVEGKWWGLLGLDECTREHEWTIAERDSLRTAADMLGAAIARGRTQDALLEAKATLEHRVVERTKELQEQMAAKEKAHVDLADAQERLIDTSRMAGMAEVATGVLHNVGNVLNSVNVSAGVVVESLRRSKAPKVGMAAALLERENGDLVEYLTKDPNGQKLPGYLSKLGEFLVAENVELVDEVSQLAANIEHIKEVVAMQQSYAKVSGVFENLVLADLVEDAIALNLGTFERHGMTVDRNFAEVPPVCADRHKVLQILINLIRNAKHALDEVNHSDKRMTISITMVDDDQVAIEVMDNGIGIPEENLTRIFAHGFTTRKEGHGFGLHTGALSAREMGGGLSVASGGLNCGAVFTLALPIAFVDAAHRHDLGRSSKG